jgi:acyl homoserine lactone synthase
LSTKGLAVIKYLYADTTQYFPELASQMFRDRARQFRDRLHWEVVVDADGFERDVYDQMNPLYVIAQNPDGRHAGSMRFLPTTAETMVNDHFLHLTQGVHISSPLIWECTRFCLAPHSHTNTAAALMMAGCELGLRLGLHHAVGVFDASMARVYRRLGWAPDVLGSADNICVGLWEFSRLAQETVAARAGLDVGLAARWFDASFPMAEKTMVA